jgi:opacity protein-like surface antigen
MDHESLFSGMAGIRREWSNLHVYLQYVRLWYIKGLPPASLFEKTGQYVGVNPADVFDFFSGSLIPGVRWNFAKKWWAHGGTIINLKRNGIIADAGVEYEFVDGFKLRANYDFIHGRSGSLLERYSDNTRFMVNLTMNF